MHPNKANFIEGLSLLLSAWPVLRTAVREEWGGHESAEKAEWLVRALTEHFDERGHKLEQEELEDILLDVMAREFNVLLEDQSERTLADQMIVLFRQSVKGQVELLNKLRAASNISLSNYSQNIEKIEDSSGDDDPDDIIE